MFYRHDGGNYYACLYHSRGGVDCDDCYSDHYACPRSKRKRRPQP
jgi:hypothetical protein